MITQQYTQYKIISSDFDYFRIIFNLPKINVVYIWNKNNRDNRKIDEQNLFNLVFTHLRIDSNGNLNIDL